MQTQIINQTPSHILEAEQALQEAIIARQVLKEAEADVVVKRAAAEAATRRANVLTREAAEIEGVAA